MKKIILTIFLIIVVAGVSGGGVWYWQSKINKIACAVKPPASLNNTVVTQEGSLITNNNSTNNTQKEDPVASLVWHEFDINQGGTNESYYWKIYVNDAYGIKFRYPADMELSDKSDSHGVSLSIVSKYRSYPVFGGFVPTYVDFKTDTPDDLDNMITENEKSIREVSGDQNFKVNMQTIKPANVEWSKYSLGAYATSKSTTYYRFDDKNGKSYVFYYGIGPIEATVMSLIISSFEFVK